MGKQCYILGVGMTTNKQRRVGFPTSEKFGESEFDSHSHLYITKLMLGWSSGLGHFPFTEEITGSNPVPSTKVYW